MKTKKLIWVKEVDSDIYYVLTDAGCGNYYKIYEVHFYKPQNVYRIEYSNIPAVAFEEFSSLDDCKRILENNFKKYTDKLKTLFFDDKTDKVDK